jgi:hypothetical protein
MPEKWVKRNWRKGECRGQVRRTEAVKSTLRYLEGWDMSRSIEWQEEGRIMWCVTSGGGSGDVTDAADGAGGENGVGRPAPDFRADVAGVVPRPLSVGVSCWKTRGSIL